MIRLRSLPALAAAFLAIAADHPADACGGCFHAPTENPTVVTDHRMIFAISPDRTTLYDQMRYSGAPSSFAWVLPIAGQVAIGLSTDELFNALDAETSVQIIAPGANCWTPPACVRPTAPTPSAAAPGGGGGVTVIASEVVGPYETVQLRASEPRALALWLSSHHYEIPSESQAIIDEYVKEKSAFLAMKLVPGASVRAMRPVRVSSPGASLTLPLRMVAAGAGATLGVTLWVVSDGRYEPQNFPSFTIGPDDVAWDWAKQSSDYTTVRAAKTASSNGTGWQIESSMDLPTRSLAMQLEYASNAKPPTPPTPPQADGTKDGGPRAPTDDELLREDLSVLFGSRDPATVRVTRMRADLSHAALRQDLRLQATTGQAVLSNLVQVTRETGQPQCAIYDESCVSVGSAPRDEAARKNGALSSPHFGYGGVGGGDSGKKWYACAASPLRRSFDPEAVLAVLAVLGMAVARRRRPVFTCLERPARRSARLSLRGRCRAGARDPSRSTQARPPCRFDSPARP